MDKERHDVLVSYEQWGFNDVCEWHTRIKEYANLQEANNENFDRKKFIEQTMQDAVSTETKKILKLVRVLKDEQEQSDFIKSKALDLANICFQNKSSLEHFDRYMQVSSTLILIPKPKQILLKIRDFVYDFLHENNKNSKQKSTIDNEEWLCTLKFFKKMREQIENRLRTNK